MGSKSDSYSHDPLCTLYIVIYYNKEYVYFTLNGNLRIILGITGEYWNNSESNR